MIDWENTLKKIIDLYNGSPFGKRVGGLVKFIELLIKLVGMNTDHYAKEKRMHNYLKSLKLGLWINTLEKKQCWDCPWRRSMSFIVKHIRK